MNGRQTVIDIVVVFLIPLAIVAGYYFFKQGDNPGLLSFIAPGLTSKPGEETKDISTKVKVALATLNTIKLDNSIFNDPVYQSLRDFPVTIATTTLGRDYPFSLPQDIQDKEKRVQSSDAAYRASISASANSSLDISAKLDALKIGIQ